uniref:FBA domain-containing protein n=1 Tax=Bos mutus grunniens TaxID=30521 RepID=A0A8C0AK01_BOSMU
MLTRWMGLIREPSPGINALVTPLSRADVWGNWSRRLGKHSWAGTRTSAGWEKEGLGPGLPSLREEGLGARILPQHTPLLKGQSRRSALSRPGFTPNPAEEPGQSVTQTRAMEEVREGPELGCGMEEPASPQKPASPPPPPSPPSPAAPETPRLPAPESPTEAHARQLLLQEWAPPRGSLELPPRLTWKLLFLRRPLYRNLLRSPNPEGINIYEPAPPTRPTQQPLEALGNFHGWHIRTEKLQQNLSWTVKQQCVDLLAEGLWEELLDDEQPRITVMDWFEDSRLDACVYELHVWLLAADRSTVIAQHHVAPAPLGEALPGTGSRYPTYSASMALASALSTSCTRPRTGWSVVGCGGLG